MIVIYGAYRLLPKRVAFRNDFCLSCGQPRRSFQIRTLDLLHIFWIPLLPIGLWKRWGCGTCGKDPHLNIKTRRSFKIAGGVLLIFISFAFWATPVVPEEQVLFWVFRIGAPLGAIATFVHLRGSAVDPTLKQHLARVLPASDMTCPVCHAPLASTPVWHCPRCRLKRV